MEVADDLQTKLEALLRLAVQRHLCWGENLWVVTLEDYLKGRIYTIMSDRQTLRYIPTGAGGTRFDRCIPIVEWIEAIKTSRLACCLGLTIS